ncbi:MAG: ComF family protein [Methylomonas sp.]|nr:ComF family protein [Methylomonas sp.]
MFCGRPGFDEMDLCRDCFYDLARNHNCCYRCAEHFEIPIQSPQLCGRCLKKTPSFDETHAPFLYDDGLRFLITRLKFNRQFKHARLLGTLLARHLAENVELPECIIPVPLHSNRYRERGFNQSIEIARHLSNQLALPLDLNSCTRNRDTAHQTGLPAKQRGKNMRHAFSVSRPPAYRHIAIVDDVMTTGATVAALASALKEQGVNRVDIWVCARA